MTKFLRKLLTKNNKRIPLYRVNFNLEKYRKGEPSCNVAWHPNIQKLSIENKSEIYKHMKAVADIIRDNLDMEDM